MMSRKPLDGAAKVFKPRTHLGKGPRNIIAQYGTNLHICDDGLNLLV